MAKNVNNVVIGGASGKMGNNVVFRQRGGMTIMAAPPRYNHENLPSESQMKQRLLFVEASEYARLVISDPERKAAYKLKAKANQTAYNIAFKDYLVAPVLHSVDSSNYTGVAGGTLTCKITDVLAVTHVKVSLYSSDGTLIEEGDAKQSDFLLNWVYTSTAENASVSGSRVLVEMTSTPGNVYEEEVMLE